MPKGHGTLKISNHNNSNQRNNMISSRKAPNNDNHGTKKTGNQTRIKRITKRKAMRRIIIVSPSGHPPTLSDRRSSDFYLHLALLPPCEALVVCLEVRDEAAKELMNFGGPRVRLEFRSASTSLLTYVIDLFTH